MNKAKARQSRKKSGYYKTQRARSDRNKVRRLMKRVKFDPTAEPAIKKINRGEG